MPTNRKLKDTFGSVGDLYDSARPDYPKQLVDDVFVISQTGPEESILEIGCGTGIATIQFAKSGCNVTGLDISKEMVSVAAKKTTGFPNINYMVSSFEDAELPQDHYDLIISAQAFHWVDPEVGYRKAHGVLKDNGYIALFWNLQDLKRSGLIAAAKEVFKKHCPDFPEDWGDEKRFSENAASREFFEAFQTRIYSRDIRYSRGGYMDLMKTHAWIASLDGERRGRLFPALSDLLSQYSEPLVIPYRTRLITARKKQ